MKSSSWMKFAPTQWTKAHMKLCFEGLAPAGISFYTEYPIGISKGHGFQVDVLVAPNLVIEVDGESHLRERRREKDEWKDAELNKAGFEVWRFTDAEVNKNLQQIVEKVKAYLVSIGF